MENLLEKETHDGIAIYSRFALNFYNAFVLGYNNRFVWKCPTRQTLSLYEQHTSRNHLDVGVGTGYYLSRARLAPGKRRVGLMDMSENCLAHASRQLNKFQPETYVANILGQMPSGIRAFDSVSMCYVLHCIPGDMVYKQIAFRNLSSIMNPGGLFFGTTLLPNSPADNWQSRLQSRIYNRRGVFHNVNDTLQDLETSLSRYFEIRSLDMTGCAAVFVAQKSDKL